PELAELGPRLTAALWATGRLPRARRAADLRAGARGPVRLAARSDPSQAIRGRRSGRRPPPAGPRSAPAERDGAAARRALVPHPRSLRGVRAGAGTRPRALGGRT